MSPADVLSPPIAAPGSAPIGVFDSGVGGLSVLRALRVELPREDFVYFADSGHAPYGERSPAYILERSLHITQRLIDRHAIKALVIACNTATAVAVQALRTRHPHLPIIGVEPALKPAVSLSQTRRIGVMATRGTLASEKFQTLLHTLEPLAQFILQPCDGLAQAIEQHQTVRIAELCTRYTQALGHFGTAPGQIDTLVLGCTHYPFALDALLPCIGPQVRCLETGEPVARHTHQLLRTRHVPLREPGIKPGQLILSSSGDPARLQAAALRWLA